MYEPEQGHALICIARHAIARELGETPPSIPHQDWMNEPGATFVTLTQNGQLRGCIGSLQRYRPLVEDVRQNALAAAFRDPRFTPLGLQELHITQCEVSLLSAASPMNFSNEEDMLAQLQPGEDGIILEYGPYRSTFLPQVWEQLPQPSEFIAHLKHKAGLPGTFWADDIRLSRYSVQKWREQDFIGAY